MKHCSQLIVLLGLYLLAALPAVAQISVNAGNDIELCDQDTAKLFPLITGNYTSATYEWKSLGTGAVVSTSRDYIKKQSAAGNGIDSADYQLKVTAVYNSNVYTAYDTVSIRVHAAIWFAFTTDVTQGCEPLTTGFSSSVLQPLGASLKYLWDFDGGRGNNTVANPGSIIFDTARESGYTVKLKVSDVFAGGQCSDSIVKPFYIRVHPRPLADFISDPEFFTTAVPAKFSFFNRSEIKYGEMYYLWDFGLDVIQNTDTSTLKDPVFIYPEDSIKKYNVTLRVISERGCESRVARQRATGSDFLSLHPQPAGDLLTISLSVSHPDKVVLVNAMGKAVYSSSSGMSGTSLSIPVSDYPAGIYYLLLSASGRQYCRKVLIE